MTRFNALSRFALVLVLTASTQSLLFVQGAFLLRQDYVAERLCVNPDTDCDGRCFLKEQMEHHGAHAAEPGHTHETDGHAPAVLKVALAVHALLPPATAAQAEEPRDHPYPPHATRRPVSVETGAVFRPPRLG